MFSGTPCHPGAVSKKFGPDLQIEQPRILSFGPDSVDDALEHFQGNPRRKSELKMLEFNDLERVQAKNRIPLFLNALRSIFKEIRAESLN